MNRALRNAMGWLAFSGLIPVAAQANDLVNIYDSPTLLTQATTEGLEQPVVSEDIDPVGPTVEQTSGIELADAVVATPVSESVVKEYQSASYGQSSCCDSCCPQPKSCCCDPGCMPFVGVAATFLAPIHNRAGVGNATVFDPNGAVINSLNSQSVSNMTVGPRLWVGVQGARFGGLVRYWRFVDDQGGLVPAANPPFTLSQGHLQLQTFDAEAFRYWAGPNGTAWLTFGVRHAQFQQGGGAISSTVVGPGLVTTGAFTGTSSYATGITNGLFGMYRIDCTNWSWFYGGRYSFLWDGNAKASVQTSVNYIDPNVAAAAINGAAFRNNGDMFIGEAQLGLQYNRALVALPMNAFFRVAMEYQYWNLNLHGGASSISFAGNPNNAIGVAAARAGGATLDLLGFNVATGFWW